MSSKLHQLFIQWWRPPPGELRVKAGVVLLAGKTVWSTPERLRGEVLTTRRYTSPPPLTKSRRYSDHRRVSVCLSVHTSTSDWQMWIKSTEKWDLESRKNWHKSSIQICVVHSAFFFIFLSCKTRYFSTFTAVGVGLNFMSAFWYYSDFFCLLWYGFMSVKCLPRIFRALVE